MDDVRGDFLGPPHGTKLNIQTDKNENVMQQFHFFDLTHAQRKRC